MFRRDPVPETGKNAHKRFDHWWNKAIKSPRKRSEYRDCLGSKYNRAKRINDIKIPIWYDEDLYYRSDVFNKYSWKKKKIKKQWMKNNKPQTPKGRATVF